MASPLLARLTGDPRRAAALYFSAGKLEAAARMFEKAGEHIEAARLWLRSGREDKALDVLKAVRLERAGEVLSGEDRNDLALGFFEEAGSFWKAGECARLLRRPLRAARLFEQAGAFELAASSFAEGGDDRGLLRAWQRLSEQLGQAGKMPEQQRIDLLRAKALVKHEELAAAAELLERHARWLVAAQLWHKLGNLERAVFAYAEGGNAVRAADLLEDSEVEIDGTLRGRVLQAVSRHKEAALAYEDAGDISGAVRQLEAAGAFAEAAERAEEKGDEQRAVELWLAAGKPGDAARVVAVTGDVESAARIARDGGDNKAAAGYYRRIGDHLLAAQEHVKADLADEAVLDLEKIPQGSTDGESANRLLVPLLVASGRYEEALAGMSALGQQNESVHLHYWQGRAYEGLRQFVSAIRCYRTVMAEKPKYRDAARRVAEIEHRRPKTETVKPLQGLRAGERVQGRFEIEAEIGRGGWSRVYRARDVVRHQPVAIKLMTRSFALLPNSEHRLREEVRLCRRLKHPHIVRVFEHGSSDGRLFVVMELAEGPTLEARIGSQGPLNESQAFDLAEQVAEGLEAAHRERVVHRDLTPANIALLPEGAKIMDFGIALSVDGSLSVDDNGNVLGTPHYMSPEQIQGLPLDGRSDLYSLGAVLFACLAGSPPFEGETVTAISLKHLQDPPPNLRRTRTDVNGSFISLVEKLLAKDPEERFDDARSFLEALHELREGPLAFGLL